MEDEGEEEEDEGEEDEEEEGEKVNYSSDPVTSMCYSSPSYEKPPQNPMKFGLSKEVGGVMGVAKILILSAQMTVHVQYTDIV